MIAIIILLILVWLAFGVHSAYYLVKNFTRHFDFTNRDLPMIVVCVLVPFVTHLATYVTYVLPYRPKRKKIEKVIFPKQ